MFPKLEGDIAIARQRLEDVLVCVTPFWVVCVADWWVEGW